ncbi:TetR/AcrR family transcriptional regulator [Parerythrobacter lacustris]|uniref:TetR/AcrR family transcriptional regulator n=1 Tax=Parerythrobacter lacustris TaxID=2969984 RepID=A0ABT1XLS5_9SPHN|nr:TetR/AcrR family transcriptional regulator [Parerythrobacter lacustris]MCR2832615.1 TetR/AcrR family transcriptional regulator [Parerythrobacter lacustris]
MSTPPVKRIGRPADEAKHAAIVEAASHAFFDVGYAAATIEGIAAEAGVSKVTVYNHFGDKRALFIAAVEQECGAMRSHFAIDPAGCGSIRDRLRAIGTAMVAFLSREEMVQFDRRIAAETERDPEIGLVFLENGPRRMKQLFAAMLQVAVGRGELAIGDTDLATEQFVSMCKGMGDLERRFGAPRDAELDRRRIDGAVEVFLRAYAVD